MAHSHTNNRSDNSHSQRPSTGSHPPAATHSRTRDKDVDEHENESTPLLVPSTSEAITSSASTPLLPRGDAPSSSSEDSPCRIPRTRVYLACFGIVLLIECVAVSMALSQNVILESILCQRYHMSSLPLDPAEGISRFFRAEDYPICKSKDVQSRLAFLRGWFLLVEVLPGIFTAIPYGFVADKYGRKLVLFLSVGGFALCAVWIWVVLWFAEYVNEAWLLFGGVFALIGGGGPIFTSMVFTTVADVTGEKGRASVFFQLGACVLIGAVAFTPLASFLESRNIWYPVLLNLISVVLAMAFILLIPETLHFRNCGPPTADLIEEDAPIDKGRDKPSYLVQQVSSGVSHMVAAAKFAIADLNIALLLFSFIFSTLGRWAGETILQYATKRFHLSWAQANYLMAIPAIATLATFVVFLPVLSHLLTSPYFGLPALKKDFLLCRISIVLLLVGALIVGVATHEIGMSIGLVFQGAGTGFNILVRSVLTSMVEQHHIGMLYNCIVIFENIGIITAGPLMANALRLGIEWDGVWLGMPYFVAAGFFTIAAGMVLMAGIEGYPKRPDETEE